MPAGGLPAATSVKAETLAGTLRGRGSNPAPVAFQENPVKLTTINAQNAVKMTREIYRQTDPLMERMYLRPDVTCRPGCNACCTLLNIVTLPEAFALANNIVSRCSEQEVADYRARLDRHIEEHFPAPTPELDRQSHFHKKVPCTLLGADGLCTAYIDRPAVCRYHFAVSDPVLCGPADDGKPRTVKWLNLEPYKMRVFAMAAGLRPGMPAAFAPLEVLLWWALLHRVDGAAAFGKAYEDPRYAGRTFDRWIEWSTTLDTKKTYLDAQGKEIATVGGKREGGP